MTGTAQGFPQKTRDIHNHHMDSTRWDGFDFRDGDIVVATYAKSGTTWMQQIISQLIFEGAEGIEFHHLSPWIDLRVMPPEAIAAVAQQTHRRCVKTHLPADALVMSDKAKYIYVGRDGRDMVWSLYNHHINANEQWYGALNGTPGLVGPPIAPPVEDPVEYFRDWLEKDGYPFWSYWESVRSWWALREHPNVMLVHFNEMKRDLPATIRRIADFLGMAPDAETLAKVTHHSTFDYMKSHAPQMAPLGGMFWNGGAETFINKGTNNRWKDVLPPVLSARYEADALRELGADCANWLSHGMAVPVKAVA